MQKNDILNLLSDNNVDITEDFLDTLVLDVTRVVDSKITKLINAYKKFNDVKVSSIEKNNMRKYLLGYPGFQYDLEKITITEPEIKQAYEMLSTGFSRNEEVMIHSLIARISEGNEKDDYVKYLHDLQKDEYQLMIIEDDGSSAEEIADIISRKYDDLSNYHCMAIIFGEAEDNWSKISQVAVFMENFKTENNFSVYNRNKETRIKEFTAFLQNNKQIKNTKSIKELSSKFFSGVSYGFQFKDLFITDDGKTKILIMQKIELDNTDKKCPSCHKEIVRGNSFSKVLYKSFECSNKNCPSRSKIGRGKRFDLLSAKRQVMLERNDDRDIIPETVHKTMRRDIITIKEVIKNLILLYSWSDDNVLLVNSDYSKKCYKGRNITNVNETGTNANLINNLPIMKLFSEIINNIQFKSDKVLTLEKDDINLINGDSSLLVPQLKEMGIKVDGAITSPPYYNAREYSQWESLLSYFTDMAINAKAIETVLKDKGVYIYNIGDIVGQDNIYVKSQMSKRRLMLGFYSTVIFELLGFNLISNIIWDKGEVESKRNSSPNMFSGYLNPINSYEHCFVFGKGITKRIPTEVRKIDTVKKINNRGKNIFGHTAPYPEEIAELILPYVKKGDLVIDPFLGSGTTSIALNRHGIKTIGFELDETYFELARSRIFITDALF